MRSLKLIIIIISIMILSSGCINSSNNGNQSLSKLRIEVKNLSSSKINVTVNLHSLSNETIFNKTIELNEQYNEGYWKDFYLNISKGEYTVRIFVDTNRTLKKWIEVYDTSTNWDYLIYDDKIVEANIIP